MISDLDEAVGTYEVLIPVRVDMLADVDHGLFVDMWRDAVRDAGCRAYGPAQVEILDPLGLEYLMLVDRFGFRHPELAPYRKVRVSGPAQRRLD